MSMAGIILLPFSAAVSRRGVKTVSKCCFHAHAFHLLHWGEQSCRRQQHSDSHAWAAKRGQWKSTVRTQDPCKDLFEGRCVNDQCKIKHKC